jgi:hypothetical protein
LPGNAGFCGPAEDGGACDGGLCCAVDCVDVLTDPANCGDCSIACAADEECVDGTCRPRCSELNEPCGFCCEGLICDTFGGGESICKGTIGGACAADDDCFFGFTCCDHDCVNTGNEQNHCGACGIVCAAGERCVGGVCRGEACSGFNESCLAPLACCDGFVCCDGNCKIDLGGTCDADDDCCSGTAFGCCDGVCVITAADPQNCGACGTRCADGQICQDEFGCRVPEGGACTADDECAVLIDAERLHCCFGICVRADESDDCCLPDDTPCPARCGDSTQGFVPCDVCCGAACFLGVCTGLR